MKRKFSALLTLFLLIFVLFVSPVAGAWTVLGATVMPSDTASQIAWGATGVFWSTFAGAAIAGPAGVAVGAAIGM